MTEARSSHPGLNSYYSRGGAFRDDRISNGWQPTEYATRKEASFRDLTPFPSIHFNQAACAWAMAKRRLSSSA